MKPLIALLLFALLGAASSYGQITVTVDDLKLAEGYSRAYVTHAGGTALVDELIGPVGGPQRWDFSNGPTGNRYDYEIIPAGESPVGSPFVGAEQAERLDFEFEQATGWTFYRLAPEGRELHGFVDPIANPEFPIVKFDEPLVDFPSSMQFLDQWSAQGTFPTQLDIGGLVVDLDVTVTLNSVVDGYGTLVLPGLGEVEVLRINELSTQTPVADIDGTPVPLDRIFSRSYIWVSAKYGIVAQITSEADTSVPPAQFPIAARFIRLIECSAPQTIADLKFDIELQGNVVVLTWEQLSWAAAYQVYRSGDLHDGEAELIGTTADTMFLDAADGERKFYWLVPLQAEQ